MTSELTELHKRYTALMEERNAPAARVVEELRAAAQELLDLIDAVPPIRRLQCQTARVFSLYEFDRLRTALLLSAPGPSEEKHG